MLPPSALFNLVPHKHRCGFLFVPVYNTQAECGYIAGNYGSYIFVFCAIQDAGRRFGYLPRMKRYQTTHEFLWYIVYGYGKPMYVPGGDNLLQDDEPMVWDTMFLFIVIIG